MKRKLIEKIAKAIYEWAKQYPNVELAEVEIANSGIGDHIDVIVVAKRGFENWRNFDRYKDLFEFLRNHLDNTEAARIFKLLTMTEEEKDRYEWEQPDYAYLIRVHHIEFRSDGSIHKRAFTPALESPFIRRPSIEKIEKAVYEWAKQYPQVEIADIEVYPSLIPKAFNVIVVAESGFENWNRWDRTDDLYNFLQKRADFKHFEISKLTTFTEDESESYARMLSDGTD
jgi:hypothetical protein